uniref:Membrane transport protein MMPL domain-containing protein n=2 Tax=Leptocylindrus danicus TaxID=163516 RepID=A0A7S2K5X9_9STRA
MSEPLLPVEEAGKESAASTTTDLVQDDALSQASDTLYMATSTSQSYYNAADGTTSHNEDNNPYWKKVWHDAQNFNVSKWYTPMCNKYRWYIVAFWIMFWPLGITYYPKFLELTDTQFDAPSGSLAANATDVYTEAYEKSDSMQPEILVYVEVSEEYHAVNPQDTFTDRTSQLYSDAKNFTEYFDAYAQSLIAEYNEDDDTDEYYATVGSYYLYESIGIPNYGADQFVAADVPSTYIGIAYASPDGKREDFNSDLEDWIDENEPASCRIRLTGITAFTTATRESSEDDMALMDHVVLPLSLLALAAILGNLSLMLVPVLCIITAICTAGTLMYPVAQSVSVTQFTPSIMMSISIAMSIDYSLFLLSRLTENLAFGADLDYAIENMLEHAGHTIIASGTTLIVCFMGYALFPMDLIRTVGYGATIAIMSCLMVNLSLTPAVMFITGEYFLKPGKTMSMLCCNQVGNPGRYRMRFPPASEDDDNDEQAADEAAGEEVEDLNENSGALTESLLPKEKAKAVAAAVHYDLDVDTPEDIEDMRNSIWYKSGRFLIGPKGIYALIGLCLIMAPVCYFWIETGKSLAFDLFLPKQSDAGDTFDDYADAFGEGYLAPYKLIFDGRETNTSVNTQECFDVMDTVIQALSDAGKFPATPSLEAFDGIHTISGEVIGYGQYMDALSCGIGYQCVNESKRTIATVAAAQNSPEGTTTYTTVILNTDPYDGDGIKWLDDARDLLDDFGKSGQLQGFQVVLQNGATVTHDAIDDVYNCFPMMIGVTLVVVFVLVGAFFRSVNAPLRSVFTIGLTLMFVYGLAVLVYQYGWLEWLNWSSVKNTGEIAWLPPIMSFSIIVGLGLDYDIFLASRVLELRLEGYDEQSSILKGLYKTGGIITAAGTIMAIAFGGLLLGGEVLLNQLAFYIFIAVLMDTFVVRTIMVPILMGLSHQYTWWPQKLPPETKSWDQCGTMVHLGEMN